MRPRIEWLGVVADGQGREHVTSKNIGTEERMKVMGSVRSILGGYNLLVLNVKERHLSHVLRSVYWMGKNDLKGLKISSRCDSRLNIYELIVG